MKAILTLLLLTATAAPAPTQSMNVPLIIETVMGEICVPFARHGDLSQAVRAAEAQGYAVVERSGKTARERTPPSGQVELYRRHHGTVTVGRDSGQGSCSVGIHEGGPEQMSGLAAPYLRALGLEPATSARNLVTWEGDGLGLEIGRGGRFRPGAELVLTFAIPAGR